MCSVRVTYSFTLNLSGTSTQLMATFGLAGNEKSRQRKALLPSINSELGSAMGEKESAVTSI